MSVIYDLEDEVMGRYLKEVNNSPDQRNREAFNKIYELVDDEIDSVTEEELNEYVLERGAAFVNKLNEEYKRKLQGIYSGVLLEKAFEENKYIEIDGKNSGFNHLFSNVRNVGKLFVKNVSGKRILESAGRYGGTVEEVYLNNVTGKWIFSNGGGDNGEIGKVFANRINGSNAFSEYGRNSQHMGDTLITNLSGKYPCSWIGNSAESTGLLVLGNVEDSTGRKIMEFSELKEDPENSRLEMLSEEQMLERYGEINGDPDIEDMEEYFEKVYYDLK